MEGHGGGKIKFINSVFHELCVGGNKMDTPGINPRALGYSIAILNSISYLILRITVKFFGYGTWALAALKGLVFSNSTTIWILPAGNTIQ